MTKPASAGPAPWHGAADESATGVTKMLTLDNMPVTVPVEMTRAQYAALVLKYDQNASGYPTWRSFLESVKSTFGCDGAITVFWCGMWLAIESDGYTHS